MNKAVDEWSMIDVIKSGSLSRCSAMKVFQATFAGELEEMTSELTAAAVSKLKTMEKIS